MNLLVISPHFRYFVRDQTQSISPNFDKINVLIPSAHFNEFVSRLPYFNRYVTIQNQNPELMQDGLNIIYAKFFTLPILPLRQRYLYLATKSCLKIVKKKKMNFSLIHAHFLDHGYIGSKIKKISNKPLILTVHGHDAYSTPFKDEWKAVARYVFNEADKIITVCEFNANKLKSFGVDVKKITIIPNGYDENIFFHIPQEKARVKLGLPHNKTILLTVASLVPAKGYSYLIDAMSIIKKKRMDILLIILGAGPLLDSLEKKVQSLGLTNQILFIGAKNHNDVPIWMNASDLFVLPSIEEGFPTVIPEAMACGIPVIGTKVGGIPEILSNRNLGKLVNPADHIDLAESILSLIEEKRDSQTIINYARKYSWNIISKEILKVYSEVL